MRPLATMLQICVVISVSCHWIALLVGFASAIDVEFDTDDSMQALQWQDTEMTTQIWSIVASGRMDLLQQLVENEPSAIMQRSADGRGAIFWSFEYWGPTHAITKYLISKGANMKSRDKYDFLPTEVPRGSPPNPPPIPAAQPRQESFERRDLDDEDRIKDDDDEDDDDDDEDDE